MTNEKIQTKPRSLELVASDGASTSPILERNYSPEQLNEIVRVASGYQVEAENAKFDEAVEFTHAQIKDILKSTGVGDQYIDRAIREVVSGKPGKSDLEEKVRRESTEKEEGDFLAREYDYAGLKTLYDEFKQMPDGEEKKKLQEELFRREIELTCASIAYKVDPIAETKYHRRIVLSSKLWSGISLGAAAALAALAGRYLGNDAVLFGASTLGAVLSGGISLITKKKVHAYPFWGNSLSCAAGDGDPTFSSEDHLRFAKNWERIAELQEEGKIRREKVDSEFLNSWPDRIIYPRLYGP